MLYERVTRDGQFIGYGDVSGAVLYPLAIGGLSIVTSIAGTYFVKLGKDDTEWGKVAHGFTDPKAEGAMPGIEYNAIADAVSWAGTLALLKQTVG